MLEIHINTNDPDYISRRDDLVRTMRRQNFLMEIGFYNEGGVKGKRGRKPAPSKRIVNYDENKPELKPVVNAPESVENAP